MVFIISVLKVLSLYTTYTAEKCKEHTGVPFSTMTFTSWVMTGTFGKLCTKGNKCRTELEVSLAW